MFQNSGIIYLWTGCSDFWTINSISLRLHDITAIQSNENAFAARRADGQVIVWGSERDGGTLPTDIEIRAMTLDGFKIIGCCRVTDPPKITALTKEY